MSLTPPDSDSAVDSHAPSASDVDAIVAKWQGNADNPLFKEGPATEPAVESAPAPEAPAPAEAAPESAPPLTSKQLSLLAEKEAELLVRRRELDAKERAFQEQHSSLEALRARLREQPAAVLRELGMSDLGALAGQLWAEELGDAAPPEFRQKVNERVQASKQKEVEQRIAELEKKAQQAASEAAFQAKVQYLDREINEFRREVPQDLKFLKRLATASPDEAYQQMTYVAAHAVNNGQWPSAREIARALDDQLRAEWERLRPDDLPAPTQPPATPEGQRKLTPTISSADTAETPDRTSAEGKLMPDDYYIQRGARIAQQLGLIKK